MKKSCFPMVTLLLFTLLMSGCATVNQDGPSSYQAVDLRAQHPEAIQRVDNFLVILDASSSMFLRPYSGIKIMTSTELVPFVGPSKFQQAKDILIQLNRTIPDLSLNGGLRTVGLNNELIYGVGGWNRNNLEQAALSLITTGGTTPLAHSIHDASSDLSEVTGDIAVIIISDGLPTNSPVLEKVASLKEQFGDRLCLHTILVGEDPAGKELMAKIASFTKCGLAVDGNTLLNAPERMADFTNQVFLKQGPMVAQDGDADQDGVKDSKDRCPDTLRGLAVDAKGCAKPIKDTATIQLRVQFDFDRAVIKPEHYDHLAKIAAFMEKHPATRLHLQGHTCNMGPTGYNQKLSERRALSVKHYLVEKHAIKASRISTKGYGESKPVVSNDTLAGRQQNRRTVTATITVNR